MWVMQDGKHCKEGKEADFNRRHDHLNSCGNRDTECHCSNHKKEEDCSKERDPALAVGK